MYAGENPRYLQSSGIHLSEYCAALPLGRDVFIVGVFNGYAIIYDRYLIRQTAALVGLVLWLVMGVFFLFGNYHSHLGIFCLFLRIKVFFRGFVSNLIDKWNGQWKNYFN